MRAIRGQQDVGAEVDKCRVGPTLARVTVSKMSPKLGRISEDSGGLKRTPFDGESVGAEPLSNESRALSTG